MRASEEREATPVNIRCSSVSGVLRIKTLALHRQGVCVATESTLYEVFAIHGTQNAVKSSVVHIHIHTCHKLNRWPTICWYISWKHITKITTYVEGSITFGSRKQRQDALTCRLFCAPSRSTCWPPSRSRSALAAHRSPSWLSPWPARTS